MLWKTRRMINFCIETILARFFVIWRRKLTPKLAVLSGHCYTALLPYLPINSLRITFLWLPSAQPLPSIMQLIKSSIDVLYGSSSADLNSFTRMLNRYRSLLCAWDKTNLGVSAYKQWFSASCEEWIAPRQNRNDCPHHHLLLRLISRSFALLGLMYTLFGKTRTLSRSHFS